MHIARILLAAPKRVCTSVALAFLFGAVLASLAAAQTSVQPAYPSSLALPAQTVQTFLQNPGSLLQHSNDQAGRVAVETRDLLASNPQTLEPMLNLLKISPPSQQAAIASGIAMASRMYSRTDPNFAAQIQAAAVATGVPAALAVSVAATSTSTATMGIKAPPAPVSLGPPTGTSTPAGGTSGGVNEQGEAGQGSSQTGGVSSTSEQTSNAPTGGFAQSVSPSR